jgi:hypothetical protein
LGVEEFSQQGMDNDRRRKEACTCPHHNQKIAIRHVAEKLCEGNPGARDDAKHGQDSSKSVKHIRSHHSLVHFFRALVKFVDHFALIVVHHLSPFVDAIGGTSGSGFAHRLLR